MQHIPQNIIPFPLIIDRLFLLCSLSGSLSLFCECNVKVLLRGLYNRDCPLSKLKMDKDGNAKDFSLILVNIWEYVTNKNRDWQVLLKLLKLDIMSYLSDGFSYTGLHVTILTSLKMIK